ncbi:MAG: hypothetical protein AAF556_00875 [Pseudomonadota bacterium]
MRGEPNTFREFIRHDTRDIHGKADQAFGAFDLTDRDDLATFMLTNHTVFKYLDQMVTDHGMAGESALKIIPELVTKLERDLTVLGITDTDAGWKPSSPDPLHPKAIAYVVQGSRLGTTVLAKQWAEATDETVKAAGQYLNTRIDTGEWRQLLADLAEIPVRGPEARKITADARTLFEVHLTALESAVQHQQRAARRDDRRPPPTADGPNRPPRI